MIYICIIPIKGNEKNIIIMEYLINKISRYLYSNNLDCMVTECNGEISIIDFDSMIEYNTVLNYLKTKGFIFSGIIDGQKISFK